MNTDRIDTIINEAIDNVLNEDFFGEKKSHHDNGVGDLINHYFRKHKKKKNKKKLRKMAGGRSRYYDYDEYKNSNREVSKADSSSLSQEIDMDKTNIAAVARDLFPDHTEEGAQSQLRKILKGERPMTDKIASKLGKMVAGGKVAKK